MQKLPGYSKALQAARFIKSQSPTQPRVGIILGSGLGAVVNRVQSAKHIPYRSIPFFPRPSVQGHSGILHLGSWGKTPVALLEGRLHLYEGYAPAEVVFPTRVMILAGIELLL